MEPLRHNGKKISKIVYSPQLKHVATWSDDDNSACIYSIEDQMKLEFKETFSLEAQLENDLLFTSNRQNFTLEWTKKILEPCDSKKDIIESNFIVGKGNNKFVLIRGDKKNYDGMNKITGSIYELCGKLNKIVFTISGYNYFKDHIMLNNNGHIFIHKHDTHIIMGWNIINSDSICHLTTEWEIGYSLDYDINECYFLSFEGKECLLVICEQEQKHFYLLDSYTFTEEWQKVTEVEPPKLELSQPYLINYNCMVFSTDETEKKDKLDEINSNMVYKEVIKEVIMFEKSKERCKLEFCDNKLHIKLVNDEGREFFLFKDEKNDFIKWNIEFSEESEESEEESKSEWHDKWDIKLDKPILSSKLLKNNNLLLITSDSIFIGTKDSKKNLPIRLHYFWNRNNLDTIDSEITNKAKDLEVRKMIEEMIENYINSSHKLGLYGCWLIKHLLEYGKFDTIEKLLKNIIKFTIQNKDENFISNLPLMVIVVDNFKKLTRYSEFINWFLSRIAFYVPDNVLSEIIRVDSSSSHLHEFGEYPNFNKVSLTRLKMEEFLNHKIYILNSMLGTVRKMLNRYYFLEDQKNTTVKLVFPLLEFTNYYEFNPPFEYSTKTNLYELWIGEALLNYKWSTYGSLWHYIILLTNIVYFTCFASALHSIARVFRQLNFLQLFETNTGWVFFVFNEYVDFGALITFTILLLELKLLFNLHVLEFFGIEFAIIFGVFNAVRSFPIILGLYILVFTSSLHILLSLSANSSASNVSWNLIDYIVASYYTLTGSFLCYKAMTLYKLERTFMQTLPFTNPYKDPFPDIFFFEAHLDELCKLVRQIHDNTWPGLYKPYISPELLKAIQMKSIKLDQDDDFDEISDEVLNKKKD
ncbi:4945_t:CDS:10 [Dentiscutata erythropus]|uniref:4945_t:CDS:1 n=1 Tax=Dentiscutata erythropus TaxID=1348616 RepID=A0A9N9HP07_9GLOM|nr:4945_t:CDS:10 [Dentiscutata erythropus]